MDGVRALDRLWRSFAQSDVAHLPVLDELAHRSYCLLDRHVRIDPVLVVEVDVVGPQAPQRAVDRLPDVVRRTVERTDGGHLARDGLVHPPRELRRHNEPLTAPFDRT